MKIIRHANVGIKTAESEKENKDKLSANVNRSNEAYLPSPAMSTQLVPEKKKENIILRKILALT